MTYLTRSAPSAPFRFAAISGITLLILFGCADDKKDRDGVPAGTAGFGNAVAGEGSGDTAGISGGTAGEGSSTAGSGSAGTGTAGTGLDECPAVSQTADNKLQAADIIIGIDTSGSMGAEIAQVQDNLNAFSKQIIDSGVDAHVILIAKAGAGTTMMPGDTTMMCPAWGCWGGGPGGQLTVCIADPLGSGMCPADSKAPAYTHVDLEIGSRDMLGKFIDAYPMYKAALRPGSLKTFVAVTDDDATQMPINSADAFIAAVAKLDPDPTMWTDWNYSGIYCKTMCAQASAVGTVHADLVTKTGGASGDLCTQDFKPVFDTLAEKVKTSVKLACEWEIPPPPDEKTFEANKTNVKLTIEGKEEVLGKAPSAAKCGKAGGWHYDDEKKPTKVLACPMTCDRMQAAKKASVKVLFGCDTIEVNIE